MARFDVRRTEDGALYVEAQAGRWADLNTCVVIPLIRPDIAPYAARRMNPSVFVEGESYVLATQYMGALPRQALGKSIANLEAQGDSIIEAIDVLLTGF